MVKKSKNKYPKFNPKFINKSKPNTNTVKNLKIQCECCNKNMVFFDFMKITTKIDKIWDSVWYCNNKECDEYKRFKF